MIYPLLYNGPVYYFARLIREEEILLEQFDTYTKQTYRNRCMIMGPNGILNLSVPVKKSRGRKTLFRDIRIDYDTPWDKVHWRSIVASYSSSPFFEFMRDDLEYFYEQRFGYLVDLNRELLEKTLRILGLEIPVRLSASFTEISGEDDPRHFIHPKKNQVSYDPAFRPEPYHQVFSDRHGFCANLSILDLLFNEGPEADRILMKSIKP